MCIYQSGRLVTGANGVKSRGYSLCSLGKVSSCHLHKDVTGPAQYLSKTTVMLVGTVVMISVVY